MFQVIWKPTAVDELTALWIKSDSATRSAVTRDIHAVESSLSKSPMDQGESRDSNRRVLFEGVLSLFFSVDIRSNQVTVLSVKLNRSLGKS